jgi:hypothetical protein
MLFKTLLYVVIFVLLRFSMFMYKAINKKMSKAMNKKLIDEIKKFIKISVIILPFILGSKTFSSEAEPQWLICSNTTNNSARLTCFDNLTKTWKASGESSMILDLKLVPAQKKVAESPKKLRSNDTKEASTTLVTILAPDNFGKKIVNSIDSIQSRIVGKFSGWKKGMKLTLDNGQVWRVKSSHTSGYKPMTNPVITISKGATSSYNAKVEGLNAVVKVQRIK